MEIDRENLPGEVEACHALIRELFEELGSKERTVRVLQHRLEQLLRWRYGGKREKVNENQLFFEAILGVVRGPESVPKEKVTKPVEGKRRVGHGRRPLPKDLPRKRVVYDLPEGERSCPRCLGELRWIGEDISERLEYVPASFMVIEEVSSKYACQRGCTVVTAGKPMQPIEKGLPGPGLLAQVAVSKYADHLPLYRQEQVFRRQGVELSRQTMCDWMRGGAELLRPLYEMMKERVLASHAVQTDDTPVGVFDPEWTRTRTGRVWTYVGDAANPFTVYDYTPTRSRDGPVSFLEDFRGYLQADAYGGYEVLYRDKDRGIIEVACWAHARRKFYEAQSSDLMRSMVMLAYIRLLYDVEREARDLALDAHGRLALRRERSLAILADIEAYLKREQPRVLPKSPMGEAIGYALGNWEALIRYGEDGSLEIDNNAAERTLRSMAVGRKNWLFFGSDKGGQTAAILASFMTTCQRLRLDPFVYLRNIFEKISAYPKSKLGELLPDNWKRAQLATIS
jgi:transposase